MVRLIDPEQQGNDVFVDGREEIYAIYKPKAGERPLNDFPNGTLYRREKASYVLSRELGWPRIPPTIIRDGPYGEGSFQLFIKTAIAENHSDPDPQNYFSLRDHRLNDFVDIAMFDVLSNNADRKAGACIVDEQNTIWAIDHGLTFNQSARRRTVMFEFNGLDYPVRLMKSVEELVKELASESVFRGYLLELLDSEEIRELEIRGNQMLDVGHYPILDPNINVPWPMV